MEHTETAWTSVQVKYLVYFNGSFWVSNSLETAERDRQNLERFLTKGVAISEVTEYINNGTVMKYEERRLQ